VTDSPPPARGVHPPAAPCADRGLRLLASSPASGGGKLLRTFWDKRCTQYGLTIDFIGTILNWKL